MCDIWREMKLQDDPFVSQILAPAPIQQNAFDEVSEITNIAQRIISDMTNVAADIASLALSLDTSTNDDEENEEIFANIHDKSETIGMAFRLLGQYSGIALINELMTMDLSPIHI